MVAGDVLNVGEFIGKKVVCVLFLDRHSVFKV